MGSYVPRGNWHRDAEAAGLVGPSDAERMDRFVADYEADKMELALGGAGSPAPQPATPEPAGPTEADWEASTVRGWTKDGEECRAVPYFAYGLRFITRYRSSFILVGSTAYAERPQLVERVGMGRVVGYRLVDGDYSDDVKVLGKLGPGGAWMLKKVAGKIAFVDRPCTVIDTAGNQYS